jgi:hypothetical protein
MNIYLRVVRFSEAVQTTRALSVKGAARAVGIKFLGFTGKLFREILRNLLPLIFYPLSLRRAKDEHLFEGDEVNVGLGDVDPVDGGKGTVLKEAAGVILEVGHAA